MILLRHGLSKKNSCCREPSIHFTLTRPTSGDNLRSTFRSQRVMMGEKTPAQALHRCSSP